MRINQINSIYYQVYIHNTMIDYQWTRLSTKLIPLIERELRTVMKHYDQLRERINRGQMQAIQQLVDFRSKVYTRLMEVDQFCQKNLQSQAIQFLFPLINRLNRVSYAAIESSKINEDYIEVPWKNVGKGRLKDSSNVSNKSSRLSISPLKESKSSLIRKSRNMKENVSPNKTETASISNSRASQQSKPRHSKSSLKIRQKTESEMDSLQEEKVKEAKINEQPNLQISFNNKELFSADKQTVFTFTMTKRQYEQVIKLKKKNGKPVIATK